MGWSRKTAAPAATTRWRTRSRPATPAGSEELREGKANIAEAYVSPENGELWLINCDIPTYAGANRFNHEPRRKRKPRLRRELAKLSPRKSNAPAPSCR
ncbi:MAG: SsrA-binding protein [Hyphomonas sp.]